MGVLSTYCQICGLPVQHDHYVPAELGSYFHIWRGDGSDETDPIIAFGPEHSWLRHAVGLPVDERPDEAPVTGLVHDGNLTCGDDDFNVWDGFDDRVAVHDACWQLAGRPQSWQPLERCEPPAEEERYRQQLFDFEAFVEDGHGWMLVDPDADSPDGLRSRRRIVELLSDAPPLPSLAY
jgi:hypothetical protein